MMFIIDASIASNIHQSMPHRGRSLLICANAHRLSWLSLSLSTYHSDIYVRAWVLSAVDIVYPNGPLKVLTVKATPALFGMPKENSMKPPKRPQVLYVEDDEDSCQMMSILLGMSGIDVAFVHGVEKTMEMPDKNKFDLFLIDQWMKDGRGTDLCRTLCREFPGIPVVFYTGCSQRCRKEKTACSRAPRLIRSNPIQSWSHRSCSGS